MSKKRVYVDWLSIIKDWNLVEDFDRYVEENNLKQHLKGKKELSLRRLARGYVLRTENIIRSVNLWN